MQGIEGLRLILWGLFKKVVIADTLSIHVNMIFDDLLNVQEEIIFKNKIGRIRDIIIHPENGKIFFLNPDGLYLMEKNKN